MSKVMLVEDDNNLREIYEARLQAEGYTIVTAHDGEEALVVAKAEQPDLIISDVMMPKISGFEMLDILRNTDGLKDVKVIMLTALGQSDDQQRADRLGADSYLVKSQVTLEDIVKVAGRLLGEDTEAEAPAPVAAEVATPEPAPAAITAPAIPEVVIAQPAAAVIPTPVADTPAPITAPEPVATVPELEVAALEPAVAIAPEPVVVAEPAVIAAPEPVSIPEPVVAVEPAITPEAAAATSEAAFVQSIGASTEANNAQPLADEAATVEAQIAEFANTASPTPVEVAPSPEAAPAVPEPVAAPTDQPEQFIATAAPDLATSVSAPAPSPQSAGNDDVLATALESLTGEAPAPAPIQATTATEAAPAEAAAARGGNRIIAPLDMPDKPDINTLLALEEAKESANAPVSVDPAGTAISVAPTVTNLPVDAPTPVVSPVVQPTATGETFDHNSIAL
ncbi:MAG: response regulator [Patescibacteria group bacterium]|nr:response regulator [Patescibacteria group bacterium]